MVALPTGRLIHHDNALPELEAKPVIGEYPDFMQASAILRAAEPVKAEVKAPCAAPHSPL
jgi:hypothetical protein